MRELTEQEEFRGRDSQLPADDVTRFLLEKRA